MVKITSDSSADLNELFDERQIPTMPLSVILDGEDHLDGVDIFPQDIFKAYEERKVLPKTAASSPENFKQFFVKHKEDGAEIVHFSLSSKISANWSNANTAAQEVGGVYVVDSLSLSSGIGLLVMYASDLAATGKYTAKEIYEKCLARRAAVQASFMVDTMEYLHKGGRCSGLTRLVATLLRIKPSIYVKDGVMGVGAKYTGSFSKNILKYVDNTLREFNNPDFTRIFVTHSYADPADVEAVKAEIKRLAPQFKEIYETKASATITAHCGRGTLGILFINDGGVQD